MMKSPYTPYSIYLRGTIGFKVNKGFRNSPGPYVKPKLQTFNPTAAKLQNLPDIAPLGEANRGSVLIRYHYIGVMKG